MVSNVGRSLEDFSIPSSQRATSSDLGQDDFLKLMVEQMRNQNPLDPQDNGEFFSQIAQFQTLDAMNVISQAITTLVEISGLSNASSLIGRSVVAEVEQRPDPDTGFPRPPQQVTGVVDRVTFDGNGAVLHVGELAIPASAVIEISDPVLAGATGSTAELLAQLEALEALDSSNPAAELLAQLEALGVFGLGASPADPDVAPEATSDGEADAVGAVDSANADPAAGEPASEEAAA